MKARLGKTILQVVFVVLLASIVQAAEDPYKPLSMVLAEVEKEHDLGKSVSAMIQMTVHTEDPSSKVQAIDELLNSIQDSLTSRDQRETQRCQDKSDWCTVTLAGLKSQVNEAQAKLEEAQEEQEEYSKELSTASGLFNDESSNLLQQQQDLAQAEQDLSNEEAQFTIQNEEYNQLIIACEEGIKLLKHMVHGEVNYGRQATNLLQVSEIKKAIDSANTHFQQTANKKLGLMEPIIAVLTTLSSQTELNYDNVMQCIQLIDEILNRLRSQQAISELRHNQSSKDLNEMIQNLKDNIHTTISLIQIYKDRVDDTEHRLEELSRVIVDQGELQTSLQGQLDGSNEDCTETLNQCSLDSASRTSELATIQRLINYFQK